MGARRARETAPTGDHGTPRPMPRPSETALKGRARALLEAMTERARWIYAVPPEHEALVAPILEAAGFAPSARDAEANVTRYANAGDTASFVTFVSAELDVLFLEAAGGDAAETLGLVLGETEFYAQSRLLGAALDVRDPEAPKALRTLAHMVVAWDADRSDLFLLHLASPDPVVRHEAVAALTVAAMVAREGGPAAELLGEAARRETFPKLKETMGEALGVIAAALGAPIQATPDPEA